MGFLQWPLDREARVSRDLLNAVPYRDCLNGEYGDEEDDYNASESEDYDRDIYNYYDSCKTNTLRIVEQ